MKKNMVVFLAVCLLLAMMPVTVFAKIITVDSIMYEYDGVRADVLGRSTWDTTITIPGFLHNGDTKVSTIRNYAFDNDRHLREVSINRPGVGIIGKGAFYSCESLTTVTLSQFSVLTRICESAFQGCSNLTSITLPVSVKEIERNAFYECPKLKIHYLGSREQWDKIGGSGKPDISIVDFAVPKGAAPSLQSATPSTENDGTLKLGKTSVKIAKTKSTSLAVTFAAGDTITVKSSNKKIATAKFANNKLKITAKKKAGKATITVTTKSGKKATVKVIVPKISTKKIKCKPVTIQKGEKIKLKPVITPAYSDDKITYKAVNKKIATVTKKGVVKGKKRGKTTITIKSGKKKIKVKVTVE